MDPQRLKAIRATRFLLQNPHAFAEELDEADMQAAARKARPRTHSEQEIEAAVEGIHQALWRNRHADWEGRPPTDAVRILDLGRALKLHDYTLAYRTELGHTGGHANRVVVAGLIDRSFKQVSISEQFHPTVQRFTAAHELGHAVLHPHAGGSHRDRPREGSARSSDRTEREADRFATLFLMPRKLVSRRFSSVFNTDVFILTDWTQAALGQEATELLHLHARSPNRRELSMYLAGATRYGGRVVRSLAEQFDVSTVTMAIRLEELGLVAI